MKRIVGLVLTFAMAHLALVGSDLVCAKHSGTQPGVAMPDMDHGQQPGHSRDEAPCKTPARVDCCQAVTSCAPSVAITSIVSVADAPAPSTIIPVSIDDVPLSRVVAPEPPPPKA